MRIYEVNEPIFTPTVTSDLLQIKGAAGKMLFIRRWWWRMADLDGILPTAQVLVTRCRYLPVTVTDGTGGGTPTIKPLDQGDSAATFTAISHATAKATTSGTAVILEHGSSHIYNGYEQSLPDVPPIGPSTSFVFELLNTTLISAPKLIIGAEVGEIS
jgi:hypothetical protein